MPGNNIQATQLGPEVSFGGQMTFGFLADGQYAIRFPAAQADGHAVQFVSPNASGIGFIGTGGDYMFQMQDAACQTPGKLYVGGNLRVGGDIYPYIGNPALNFHTFASYNFDGQVVCTHLTTDDLTVNNALSIPDLTVTDQLICASYADGNQDQVVGTRQAAVADAALTLASVQAQLNSLLAKLRTHGLIAP